jgi:hypothetical protein
MLKDGLGIYSLQGSEVGSGGPMESLGGYKADWAEKLMLYMYDEPELYTD